MNAERIHEYYYREKHESCDNSKKPILLVWPTWSGLSAFEKSIADRLSHWGFDVVAIDLYGATNNPVTLHEKRTMMEQLTAEPTHLQQQLESLVKQQSSTPEQEFISIGFCLGGRLALETGLNLTNVIGAVSFHGLLNFPLPQKTANPDCKFVLFNGYQDPMVTPEQIAKTQDFFDTQKLDWQLIQFGRSMHSFMLPEANSPENGSCYHEASSLRGLNYLRIFLEEYAD